MADFILPMPPRFFARVFGNPAGDPVLLKSRGVTLLRDRSLMNFSVQVLKDTLPNVLSVFSIVYLQIP